MHTAKVWSMGKQMKISTEDTRGQWSLLEFIGVMEIHRRVGKREFDILDII